MYITSIKFVKHALKLLNVKKIKPHVRLNSQIAAIMKLETEQFQSILTEEVKLLEKIFVDHGHEIRIAGGAVRDLLLGIQPKDLDFATTATPDEMKDIFTKLDIRMINAAGEKHGTITPRINDKENFEVTTLRIDVVTDGRRAEVEFTRDWQLDANRRDLTINSMFLGLDGTVYDYCNGYEDIKNRRVVFVGDASKRIQEDYLRILRYFRFYGRIAKDPESHDAATLEDIRSYRTGLERISGERVWMELRKILKGRFPFQLVKLMLDLELGPYIGIPEYNIDQFNALCHRLEEAELSVLPVTLLCGLFDTEDEMVTFHKRCKLSNFERDLGVFLIRHRGDKPHEKPIKPYQMLVITTFNSCKPTDVRKYLEEVLKYRGDRSLYEQFSAWALPEYPVNGNIIRQSFPNVGGKEIGFILQKLKEAWAKEDFKLSKEDLLAIAPDILSKFKFSDNKRQKVR